MIGSMRMAKLGSPSVLRCSWSLVVTEANKCMRCIGLVVSCAPPPRPGFVMSAAVCRPIGRDIQLPEGCRSVARQSSRNVAADDAASSEVSQQLSNRCSRSEASAQIRPKLAKSCTTLADLDDNLATFSHFHPTSLNTWAANSSPCCQSVDRCWPAWSRLAMGSCRLPYHILPVEAESAGLSGSLRFLEAVLHEGGIRDGASGALAHRRLVNTDSWKAAARP